MKKTHILFVSLIVLSSLVLFGCTKRASGARAQEVVVYTYDSFISEWGPGPEIAQRFEAQTGLKLTFVDCGDGVQVLSRAIIEKDNVQADVVLGLDNNTAKKALDAKILVPYKPKDADTIIDASLKAPLGTTWELVPYDYSHFAIIYDKRSDVRAPKSLADLTDAAFRKKLILMDPRTSTPGLGFVAWTKAVFGDGFEDYWRALKPNILTMAPGWSAGYGLFTNGEAPLVISYTTSPAANIEYDGVDYYEALLFGEGHAIQVEGAGILAHAPNEAGARAFMDFLISAPAQETLPLTQWMYPVNKTVALPDCYARGAVIPEKTVTLQDDAEIYAAQAVRILGE